MKTVTREMDTSARTVSLWKESEGREIELVYESIGDGPPILLVMGLGAQMTMWPDEFCRLLADEGLRVIRFDNRDIGLSTKLHDEQVPSFAQLFFSKFFKRPIDVPYTLEELAGDAVGLLDEIEIESAHVVGASMGGMISQLVAINFPDRVRTLTSIMSHTGQRRFFLSSPSALKVVLTRTGESKEEVVDRTVRVFRTIGSTRYFDEERLRDLAGRNFERSFYPQGFLRQMAAIMASPSRAAALEKVEAPTLVIHGEEDPLVRPSGGRATAQRVPDARLEIIEDMGHDLPAPLWPDLVELIATHVHEFEGARNA